MASDTTTPEPPTGPEKAAQGHIDKPPHTIPEHPSSPPRSRCGKTLIPPTITIPSLTLSPGHGSNLRVGD